MPATARVILRVTKVGPVVNRNERARTEFSVYRVDSQIRAAGRTSPGALVVEEDAVAAEHVVGLPVVDGDPKAIQLCHALPAEGEEEMRSVLLLLLLLFPWRTRVE